MLQSTSKVLMAAMLCGTLTACSSSSSTGDGPDHPSFGEYREEADRLADEIEPLAFTDPASLPTTGSAEYEGLMALAVDAPLLDLNDVDNLASNAPESILVGDLELNASFADSAVTGRVTNIVDGNNDEYEGSLAIDDVYFNRDADVQDEYTYGASLTGSVTDPDGEEWDVDADVDGDFVGDNWSHTVGDVVGDACSTASATCVDLEGFYGAKR